MKKSQTINGLHKLITDNARNCIGIDIDRESIDYVKKETGYDNVVCGNILTDEFPGNNR